MAEGDDDYGNKVGWPWDWRNKELTDETLTDEIRLEIVRDIPEYAFRAAPRPRYEASEGFLAYCKVAEDYFERAVIKAPPSLEAELSEIAREASRVLNLFHEWVGLCRLEAYVPNAEEPYLKLEPPFSFPRLRDRWNAVVERLNVCMGRGWEKKKQPTSTGTEAEPLSDTPQNGGEIKESAPPMAPDDLAMKKRFEFRPGQVLFDGKDLNIKTGLVQDVLNKLVDDFGRTVEFKKLHTGEQQDSDKEACDELRGAISYLNRTLKKLKGTPVTIKNSRGWGYKISSRD